MKNADRKVGAWLLLGAGLIAAQGWAAAAPAKGPAKAAEPVVTPAAVAVGADDAFNFFLQEAQVVTASRRAQKKSDSPVAIDVITREEIEASGARTIYDLLRFRVGLDVVEGNSIEGNPAQVNVRGLPEEFSQSLQVLIDGRSVVSVGNSGVYWRRLPVSIDEIARIEIVRGPNSALFGANAGQGVINIITIKPGNAGQFNVEMGTSSQRKAHLAADSGPGAWAARGSYETRGNASSRTIVNEQPVSGNETSDDTKINARVVGTVWDGGELDLSVGHMKIGYSYPVALGVGGSTSANNDYEYLRLTHALNEDLQLEGSFWRRYEENASSLGAAKETVYDTELLVRLSSMEQRLQTIAGISGREGFSDAPGLFSDTQAGSTSYAYTRSESEVRRQQHQRRVYLSEQFAVNDMLSVSAAGSFENSDTGGQQPAYQGAIIVKPSDESTLRLSGSKSPTMPSLLNKYSRLELVTGVSFPYAFPFNGIPRLSVIRVEGTDINPPQVSNFEATYSTSFMDRRLTAEVTGFQMEINGYPEFTDLGTFSFTFPTYVPEKVGYVTYYKNAYDMVARGLETTLVYRPSVGRSLQLNHTYEDVRINVPTTRYSYTTPWNKVNLIASSDLIWGFHVATNIGWQGQHYSSLPSKGLTIFIPDQAKVDARIGYSPHKDVEIYALGTNLDHAIRTESPDGFTSTQSFAGGVNIAFGGSKK